MRGIWGEEMEGKNILKYKKLLLADGGYLNVHRDLFWENDVYKHYLCV